MGIEKVDPQVGLLSNYKNISFTSPIFMEAEIDLVHISNKLSCVSIFNRRKIHVYAAYQNKWNEIVASVSLKNNQE